MKESNVFYGTGSPHPMRSDSSFGVDDEEASMNTDETLAILIVDDDAGDRRLCQRALKSALGDSLRLFEADSGESGLELIETHSPNCVLLDFSLPGINGVEVLKQIRRKHPYLPVIMIDGKGNDIVAVQSMKEGAQDYIAKRTITPRTVQRAVRMAIKHSALQKHSHQQRTSLEIFTRALAHDLKEPVRTIRSFLDRMSDWRNLCEKSQQSFQHICKSAERMSALIDAVHLYTSLDSDEQMEKTFCDIAAVLKDVQENLAQLIDERRAVITFDELPHVYANDVQMHQLFQNLLANAIRHSNSAVRIHVSVEEHEDNLRFEVRDNGPGIAPEHLETIFEPFKRFSHRKGNEPGLGLGLAINRKIVELHGGRIWCESQGCRGTSFLIELPKCSAISSASKDATVNIPSPNLQSVDGSQSLARILLVDDNEVDIELNSIFLIEQPKLHCEVMTARDGEEGLAIIRDAKQRGHPIDLILLDINMPVMDGFEMLRQIKKEQMSPNTLVVMCTTSDDEKDKRMAKSLGAIGYLTKPPRFSLFKEVIEQCGLLRLSKKDDNYILVPAA